MLNDELKATLITLGMHYLANNIADFCALITKKKSVIFRITQLIARQELEERLRRGTVRRVSGASLGRFRPLTDFDWAWPKKINREMIADLMTLRFLEEPANAVIFESNQGNSERAIRPKRCSLVDCIAKRTMQPK